MFGYRYTPTSLVFDLPPDSDYTAAADRVLALRARQTKRGNAGSIELVQRASDTDPWTVRALPPPPDPQEFIPDPFAGLPRARTGRKRHP